MTGAPTPGPWTATQNEIDELLGEWTIRDADGGYVADVRNPYVDYDMAVGYAADPNCRMPHDARLIAAAPALYEALGAWQRALRGKAMSDEEQAAYNAGRAALAAAQEK